MTARPTTSVDTGCHLRRHERDTTVYGLIATGHLETMHIARSMRIPADSVHAFIALRRHRP